MCIVLEVQLKPDKPVFVMTWEGKKPKLLSILLNSHVDVVPVFAVSALLLYYLCVSGNLGSIVIGWNNIFYVLIVQLLFDVQRRCR